MGNLEKERCSFCGMVETKRKTLIKGKNATICKDCTKSTMEEFDEIKEFIETSINRKNEGSVKTFLKPHEVKKLLDEHIVGQEEAKKIISVAVYNHFKRIHLKSEVDIQKSNILLVGPSGSGKTYIMQTLAEIMDMPIVIADATAITEAGYIGEDVESLLEKLLQKADGDLEKAQKGIIYIDEIDKISRKGVEGRKNIRDVSGEGVQQALLKIIEDSEVYVKAPGHKGKVLMSTKNILFVCGGAFVGINKIAEERYTPEKSTSIGFGSFDERKFENNDNEKGITQQDVINFGFIPELAGRVPVIANLSPLTIDEMKDILTKPKNAIVKQYQELFKMDGVQLTFHQKSIDYIAKEAMKKEVGARGLKSVIEKKMYELMYELPKQDEVKNYLVTEAMLNDSIEKQN